MSFRPCNMAMCSAADQANLNCATTAIKNYSCFWRRLTVRAVVHQLLRRRVKILRTVDHQIRMMNRTMRRRRMTNCEEAASFIQLNFKTSHNKLAMAASG